MIEATPYSQPSVFDQVRVGFLMPTLVPSVEPGLWSLPDKNVAAAIFE